jgi:hypothetical protein
MKGHLMKKTLTILTVALFCASNGHASSLKEDIPPIERYRFAAKGVEQPCTFVTKGLSDREETHSWTSGKSVTIEVPLFGGVRSALFENVSANGSQSVGVYVNGQFWKGYFFNEKAPKQTIHVGFSPKINPAVVEFRIPYACRPGKDDPSNPDPRELGLALKTVAIYSEYFPMNRGVEVTPLITEQVRLIWASNINNLKPKGSFSLMSAQRLKTAIVELEEALDTYVAANNVKRAEVWDDPYHTLSRMHNRALLACERTLIVERLTSEWKAEDTVTPQPIFFANAISAIFDRTWPYMQHLRDCPQGKLEEDSRLLRVKANEAADRLRTATLDELIAGVKGDDLKLHAIAIRSFDKMVPRPNYQHYVVHFSALEAAGITFKEPEEVVDEMFAIELPVITKLQLVDRYISTME